MASLHSKKNRSAVADRGRRPAGSALRPPAFGRWKLRLLAWVVAQAATLILLLISHFTVEACALCRMQQFLMVVLLALLSVNLADERPRRFLRQAVWLAGAGLLVVAAHFVLSVGFAADPCGAIAVCGHPASLGASRASPALVALLSFGAILLLSRKARLTTQSHG